MPAVPVLDPCEIQAISTHRAGRQDANGKPLLAQRGYTGACPHHRNLEVASPRAQRRSPHAQRVVLLDRVPSRGKMFVERRQSSSLVQLVNQERLKAHKTHGICTAKIHVCRNDLSQSNVFCCGFVVQRQCQTRGDGILSCPVRLNQRQWICRACQDIRIAKRTRAA